MANTTSIMSNIEFFKAVAALEGIDAAITEKAEALIAKDAADKAKAKAKRAEKVREADANVAVIAGLLTTTPQTCTDLANACSANGMVRADDKPITNQYVARLMKVLVDNGSAVKTSVKGEKNKIVAYTIAG